MLASSYASMEKTIVDGDPSKDIGVLRTGIRLVMKDGKVVRDRMAG